MVCVSVREDNPRTLASGSSPVETQKHAITAYCTSMYLQFVLYGIFEVKHWNISERSNKCNHSVFYRFCCGVFTMVSYKNDVTTNLNS